MKVVVHQESDLVVICNTSNPGSMYYMANIPNKLLDEQKQAENRLIGINQRILEISDKQVRKQMIRDGQDPDSPAWCNITSG